MCFVAYCVCFVVRSFVACCFFSQFLFLLVFLRCFCLNVFGWVLKCFGFTFVCVWGGFDGLLCLRSGCLGEDRVVLVCLSVVVCGSRFFVVCVDVVRCVV